MEEKGKKESFTLGQEREENIGGINEALIDSLKCMLKAVS